MTLDKQYFRDKYPSNYNIPLPEVSVAINLLLDEIENRDNEILKLKTAIQKHLTFIYGGGGYNSFERSVYDLRNAIGVE